MQARAWVAIGFVAAATLAATVLRGQGSATAELSAMDYFEIEQLVSSYAYALDTGSNDGYDYADLFAPDGVFVGMNQGTDGRSYRGRETLAALARGGTRGPLNVSHFITNLVIEPTADGARGSQYALIARLGENGEPGGPITNGGRYEDEYVRTPDGWRFRSRVFYAAEPGADPKQLRSPPGAAPPGPASSGAVRR